MYNTIWKYSLQQDDGEQIVEAPAPAKPISIGLQNHGGNVKELVMWVIVDGDPDVPLKKISVWHATTGNPHAIPASARFLGTYQDGWFGGHVFVQEPV